MKVALICAYNEEKHIKKVVNKTLKYVDKVIVVEDGSKDDTLKELKKTKAIVLSHKINKGKGEALKTGFRYCLKKKYDPIILLDADGQHDPSEISKLLRKLNEGYDIVIGRRRKSKSDMKLIRRLANFSSSFILSLILKQKVHDTQSGYRVIKSKVIKNLNLESKKYDLESELLIKSAKKGYRIGEVEVKTIYGEEVSTIHPVKDTLRFFRLIYKGLKW